MKSVLDSSVAVKWTLARWFPSVSLVNEAFQLALKHQRAVYDCLYLALAIREKCQLITADEALVRQLQPSYGCLVSLSSLPCGEGIEHLLLGLLSSANRLQLLKQTTRAKNRITATALRALMAASITIASWMTAFAPIRDQKF